jgi:hypothetical protein
MQRDFTRSCRETSKLKFEKTCLVWRIRIAWGNGSMETLRTDTALELENSVFYRVLEKDKAVYVIAIGPRETIYQ